jgi:hypothetical protein
MVSQSPFLRAFDWPRLRIATRQGVLFGKAHRCVYWKVREERLFVMNNGNEFQGGRCQPVKGGGEENYRPKMGAGMKQRMKTTRVRKAAKRRGGSSGTES